MEKIDIGDIMSGCKEKIVKLDEAVRSYMNLLNEVLPKDSKIKTDKLIFDITRECGSAYEDDGRTQTEGYQYVAIWSLPFTDDAQYDDWKVRNGHSSNCLSVIFTGRERIHDHKEWEGMLGITMSLSKIPQCQVHQIEMIDSSNDNHSLTKVFNRENFAYLVLEIEKLMKMNRIMKIFDFATEREELSTGMCFKSERRISSEMMAGSEWEICELGDSQIRFQSLINSEYMANMPKKRVLSAITKQYLTFL